MKFCEECGAQLSDDAVFCEECGTPVEPAVPQNIAEEQTVSRSAPVTEEQGQSSPSSPDKKSSNGKIVAGVISALVVIGVIIGALFVNGAFDSSDETVKEEKPGHYLSEENTSTEKPEETKAPEPTEEVTPESTKKAVKKDNSYILKDSNKRYLGEDDVGELSTEEIHLARNEIYARRGYIFKDKELRKYFKKKAWYKPKVKPSDFRESVLNKYEKANVKFLSNLENGITAEVDWEGTYSESNGLNVSLEIYDVEESGFGFNIVYSDGSNYYSRADFEDGEEYAVCYTEESMITFSLDLDSGNVVYDAYAYDYDAEVYEDFPWEEYVFEKD